jgi:PAS domain S-box-containing protein
VRKIDRRFRAVVNVASEGIWTVDEKGRTTFVNPRMADMLGYTLAEMRGRRFTDFLPPAGIPPVEAGFRQLAAGIPERSDCELLRKDGSTLWVHYAATPLSDGSRFIGSLAVVADISEQKRHEATIQRQSEALERANRQKEDFLAMLGHELRNPVAPLITAVKLMELKSDGAFERERTVIARQAEQIARIVDDISDVSRFMRGKLHIRCETVNVADVIRDASDSLSPLFARKRHTLDVHVPDELIVQGDRLRLRQVLVNLLTNAAKYTPPGDRVVVTAETDDDRVVIRVRDNGVGISGDFLPMLFEPFTQKPETIRSSEGGLGLGLAIVKGIVQAHGGTIEARSGGAGQGSEFIVRLPVVLPETAAVVDGTETTAEIDRVADPT